jgi:hypothetical protein
MRKDFQIAVGTKQKYIKNLQENMTDQTEMTCVLNEVKVAKQAAMLMSKKAEEAFKSSNNQQQKLKVAEEIICNLQI